MDFEDQKLQAIHEGNARRLRYLALFPTIDESAHQELMVMAQNFDYENRTYERYER